MISIAKPLCLFAILAVLIAACGDSSDRLTLDEYVTAYCEISGASEVADQEYPTIGQSRREFVEDAGRLDRLTPPAVVEAYHEA